MTAGEAVPVVEMLHGVQVAATLHGPVEPLEEIVGVVVPPLEEIAGVAAPLEVPLLEIAGVAVPQEVEVTVGEQVAAVAEANHGVVPHQP